MLGEGERATLNGLGGVATVALLDPILEVLGGDLAGDDVVGEDLYEGGLVLRLDEVVDGACGELGEGGIGGSEDGEGASAFEGVDETGSLDGGDEGLVDGGVDRVLDDVLGRVHGGAADGGVGHLRASCERGDGKRSAGHEGDH